MGAVAVAAAAIAVAFLFIGNNQRAQIDSTSGTQTFRVASGYATDANSSYTVGLSTGIVAGAFAAAAATWLALR